MGTVPLVTSIPSAGCAFTGMPGSEFPEPGRRNRLKLVMLLQYEAVCSILLSAGTCVTAETALWLKLPDR